MNDADEYLSLHEAIGHEKTHMNVRDEYVINVSSYYRIVYIMQRHRLCNLYAVRVTKNAYELNI